MEKIQNVNEFITHLNSTRESMDKMVDGSDDNHQFSIFYRGHSDTDFELKPGIYRRVNDAEKSLIEYEHEIYKEMIAKVPNLFDGKSTLESLTIMQHYEVPTRVLDLTENPLVALYFAVNKDDDKDGEVLVFGVPDIYVCSYDSDRVTILANLAKCDPRFEYDKHNLKVEKSVIEYLVRQYKDNTNVLIMGEEHRQGRNFILDYFKDNEMLSKFRSGYLKTNFDFIAEKVIDHYEKENPALSRNYIPQFYNEIIHQLIRIKNVQIDSLIKEVNDHYFGKLLHAIRDDKGHFQSIIDPMDLDMVYAVKPKLNNNRILRQQGAFLIFGVSDVWIDFDNQIKPMPEIYEKWIASLENPLIVAKEKKPDILKELDGLGINEATLFPEIDKVSGYVKEKYTNRILKNT